MHVLAFQIPDQRPVRSRTEPGGELAAQPASRPGIKGHTHQRTYRTPPCPDRRWPARQKEYEMSRSEQLRTYTVRDGLLDEWVERWRSDIVPLRLALGFQISGAWGREL